MRVVCCPRLAEVVELTAGTVAFEARDVPLTGRAVVFRAGAVPFVRRVTLAGAVTPDEDVSFRAGETSFRPGDVSLAAADVWFSAGITVADGSKEDEELEVTATPATDEAEEANATDDAKEERIFELALSASATGQIVVKTSILS